MSGIAGLVFLDGQKPSMDVLERMTKPIVHRGPGDCGYWVEKQCGLAFRRLSISDTETSGQPLSNEDDSIWVVFNGAIYNDKSLRSDLVQRGHQFKSESDAEIIVHLYEEYGEDCVQHLRGMFAFAMWDRNRQHLFAARDHFGIKPFYYVFDGKQFVFASEIKSILQSGCVEAKLNNEALFHYFTFQYTPEPDTMFQHIRKLPPAHRIVLRMDGSLTVSRYWETVFEPEERPFEDVVEQLRETLKQSVQMHLPSGGEHGSFLSSGIDSTAISAIMRYFEPIKTFSVGFAGRMNETDISRDTAAMLGTEHYEKVIGKEEYFNSLPKAVWNLDEPLADPSAIALYHVAALAREHVAVVLSGEGADELFGGYRIYREPLSLRPIAAMPRPIQKWLHRLAMMLPEGMKGRGYLLRGTTPLERRFLGNARIFSEEMKAELLAGGKLARWFEEHYGMPIGESTALDPFAQVRHLYATTEALDPVTRMQYIDLNMWLPGDILLKADKMTMAHSLEVRMPFLDKEMFELARKIPASYRIAEGTTKYVFRKAMEGIVPDSVLHRPKLGFPVPIRDWLREAEGEQVWEQIVAGSARDYFNRAYVERLLKYHREGRSDYSRHLWTLYIFSLWHKQFLGSAQSTPNDGDVETIRVNETSEGSEN